MYRGRAEVREWIEEILEAVQTIHNEIVEITELRDDRVFTDNVVTGRGTGSGVPVELRYWSVLWVAEGKVARRQVFWNRDEALEAAGLSE
ncbi:MAG: nuclear transport factor 2 family protein [Solirubrobacterales bacterium]